MGAAEQDAADGRWHDTGHVGTVPSPTHGGLTLASLILGATVANLNLAVANVALPSIGRELGTSQSTLNLIAVGFTLGLAASVLYLGALADRYGRRLMLVTGLALSLPASAVAAWAPTAEVLVVARVIGGLAAGMAFPSTLSLIAALYRGRYLVMAIALWSGIGAGASSLGPVVVGALITSFWWGSAFAITIPLAAAALAAACIFVPRHTGESRRPVDHVGGILSIIMVGSLIMAINLAPMPGAGVAAYTLGAAAVVCVPLFLLCEKHAPNPVFDLAIASRRLFWVAGLAGIIAFGALMGSLFIGQQFLQDVLGYSPLQSGLAVLPLSVVMVAASPLSARLITSHGTRTTLTLGFLLIGVGFLVMLTWREGSTYAQVGSAYAVIGLGVGIGGAPASRSIMSAVPTSRAGMGSATTDLQRDLGGAVMQSILGALLSIRYAAYFTKAFATLPPEQQKTLSEQTAAMLKSSFGGAARVAHLYPGKADEIMEAARRAFTSGSSLAVGTALLAVLGGLALVLAFFPRKKRELELEQAYADHG